MFDNTDQTMPGYYSPSQTALLLLDFHQMFIAKHGGTAAPAAAEVAAKLRIWAKTTGIEVIHCLVDLNGTPAPTCKDSGRFRAVVNAMKQEVAPDEPEWLTDCDELTFKRQPGYVSALKSPGLLAHLKERGIRSLILTGLSTSGCVLRTCMTATDEDFVVTSISDAAADPGEGVHDFVVSKMLSNRGYVARAEEFIEGYSEARCLASLE